MKRYLSEDKLGEARDMFKDKTKHTFMILSKLYYK